MTLQRARVEIDADVNGDGDLETGEFNLVGNLVIDQTIRPQSMMQGGFERINAAISNLLQDGTAARRGVFLDLGAGDHIVEVNFVGWEGAIDPDTDEPLQWGDTGDDSEVTQSDATGADPLTQMQVLHRYIQVGLIHSLRPARLWFGEYSEGGIYEEFAPLSVAIVPSKGVRDAENPETYDGSMSFVEILDLNADLSVRERREY